MKQRIIVFLGLFSAVFFASGQVSYKFKEPHGVCWYAPQTPSLSLTVLNNNSHIENKVVLLKISSDIGTELYQFTQQVNLQPCDSVGIHFSFPLAPGFYHCTFSSDDSVICKYNVGYEPEHIVALSEEQPDFDEFWKKAKEELAKVAPEYNVVKDTTLNSTTRNGYHVTMRSLDGELLRCYLLVPKTKGKHPAIIHFQGYNADAWAPAADSRPEYIEFVLSVRGQGWNKPYNTHGDWLVENLADANKYYYRGAYMDVVRGIDFVCQLSQYDGVNLFAEGLSQGGLLTYVAAALDKRVVAIAPCCPFLGDIPSYLYLGSDYVKGLFQDAFSSQNISLQQFAVNMSYFDLKSLCRRITVPVYMAVGLQDPICPPYTNFAAYNAVKAPKQYIIYPEQQHSVNRLHWEPAHLEFFNQHKR